MNLRKFFQKYPDETAKKYEFNFFYRSTPNWQTYQGLLSFAEQIRKDTRSYHPKDYIDLKSFIWVTGSD